MRIAICDDDKDARVSIIMNINNSCNFNEHIDLQEYYDAISLVNDIKNGMRYDIIFLDVEMPGKDGVSAGVELREYDKKTIIIFVSSYPRYAIPAYDCEAYRFLVKPIDSSKFHNVMQSAINKYNAANKYYSITNRGITKRILVANILYIGVYHKHLTICTFNETYETSGRLNQALSELAPYGFYQVHQGYIVNMNYINEFDGNDIILTNGTKVMISTRKRNEVIKAYADFVRR